ncbi:minichromosome maintenance complex component 4-like protein (nucleomorph) [Chroomonas mesostigmatica CCMP1168]|uniref:DNA replication licensing factor MCM4 n=1 Tax=Chroomonas mesostigmatica CCMP1168 TaxID=1195612 RepID=J7G7I7_9CRYP|nr:minichromosome maintenance complex component 4-like protein [Chroomonas mesostigmatica CCMP1168]
MDKLEKNFFPFHFDLIVNKQFQNISEDIMVISKRFVKFLIYFKSIKNRRSYFPKILEKTLKGTTKNIRINLSHLASFDPYLYFKIQKFPTEMISVFDFSINNFIFLARKLRKNYIKKKHKVFFLHNTKTLTLGISSLGPKNLNKLVTIKGLICRISSVVPELTAAFFQCEICCYETYSFIEKGNMVEPVYCINCRHFHSFQISYKRSSFTDKQFMLLQQVPMTDHIDKNLPTMIGVISNDLFYKIQTGDFVEVTGILRISSLDKRKLNNSEAFFQFYMEVLYIYWENKHFLKRKKVVKKIFEKRKLKKKEKEVESSIKKESLIQNPNIYLNYLDCIVPNLIGYETLKHGICHSLFQTTKNSYSKKCFNLDKPFNILFIEKAGFAKSQILRSVAEMTRNAEFIDGENIFSENPILSKKISKSMDTDLELNLENFFLKNKKLICIDKINELHGDILILMGEFMKNKWVSVVKSGVVCEIDKKINFIGTIEFLEEQNKIFSLIENPFLPNFDLVYFLKSPSSAIQDRRLAKHLLSLYFKCFGKEFSREKYLFGIGIKSKILLSILSPIKNYDPPFFPDFCVKEIAKWKTVCHTLKKYKSGSDHEEKFSVWEVLVVLSQTFSELRFSNLINLEDIRHAGIVFLETLNSWKKFDGYYQRKHRYIP